MKSQLKCFPLVIDKIPAGGHVLTMKKIVVLRYDENLRHLES